MLTLRIKSCEASVVREVICRRRSEAVAAARVPASSAARDPEDAHDELFMIARLLEDMRERVPERQPRILEGPTWLLDSVIRDAACEAVEQLSEAVDVFRADVGKMSRDALRAAADTASAQYRRATPRVRRRTHDEQDTSRQMRHLLAATPIGLAACLRERKFVCSPDRLSGLAHRGHVRSTLECPHRHSPYRSCVSGPVPPYRGSR
jgi:hypothetical protein